LLERKIFIYSQREKRYKVFLKNILVC